jgi:methionyl-tRNA formyltransferase
MCDKADRRTLRVLLVTEDDPLFVRRFFEVFFQELPRDSIEVVGVTVSRAFHEPLPKTAKRVLRFFGPIDFVKLLPQFVAAKLSKRSIGDLARSAGLPLLPAESVNSDAYRQAVSALGPDVIVSVAAPEIFKSALLSVPSIGCLNIHSGRLPEYRGMMPTFWQMLGGEESVTVTIHEMVPKLDAGGVIATETFKIEQGDSLERVMIGTKQLGARLMIRVLLGIAETGKMPPSTALDMSRSRLFKFPQPADVRAFRARGFRILE